NGRQVASYARFDKALKFWDVDLGKEVRSMEVVEPKAECVAISDDGRRLLVGGQEGQLDLFDLATGKRVRELKGHHKKLSSVAFLPGGRQALSGSWDPLLKLWDTTTGKSRGTWPLEGRVVLSSDGRLTFAWDERIRETQTGKILQELSGSAEGLWSAAFSPD